MFDIIDGAPVFTCDGCCTEIEQGYRVGDDFYCEDCMLDYLKSDVCEQIFVKEDDEEYIEVSEDEPGAEAAYQYNGDIYKDDESGTFNELLLDDYIDYMVTVEELVNEYEEDLE